MKIRLIAPMALTIVAIVSLASTAWAHEVTYLGAVVTVEATRVQVKTTDPDTTKPLTAWFLVSKDTKIKRGERVVSFAEAKIMPNERIAVTIDHDAKTKMVAIEVRLAEMDMAMAMPAAQQMPGMDMAHSTPGWHLMQDGVVYGLFNHQGGPRGGNEFVLPNWWMGMLTRNRGRHQVGLNMMFSLDPATVGKSGYRELFQVGEALDGKPLIDRQHPHDLFMQLAGSWRITISDKTAFTLAGGPVGEPTLGPVAFMHRPSAAGLVLAPLGHHTFDSTHISFGVVTAGMLERGRWTFEGSVFNGREPDQDRWDFDLGRMDSVAGRVWFRPTPEWDIQVSTGHLRNPEELEPGDVERTTASVSWFRQHDDGFKAVTVGYGVNAAHGERRHGLFGEFTIERDANSIFGRAEVQQVETSVLITDQILLPAADDTNAVGALSLGGARRLARLKGFEGALGVQVTVYRVPEMLRATHGAHPVSAQVFLRVRLPAGDMGRMWNMRMSEAHTRDMGHGGHVMR